MGPANRNIEARVREMVQAQIHRGPDGVGVMRETLHDYEIALGHCRLAILGLGVAGRQPMTSKDGRWTIVFNGEIFNYMEIRGEFGAGFSCRTGTDTEVLLEAIARWGVEPTLQRSEGMFALALWDRRNGELILARDRLGEKPMVYFFNGEILSFASEIRGLQTFHQGLLESSAVDAFLVLGYVPAPLAIFRECRKLEPGSLLRYRAGSAPVTKRWWFPEPVRRSTSRPLESSGSRVAALRERISEAIRLRLRADVPVALSLSGGVDSSVIAAECVRLGASPDTFTVSMEGHADEAEHARTVACHLGLRHEILTIHDVLNGQEIESMSRHYDEPFADSAAIPSLAIARAVAGRFKVVLNGDGGDEVFGGYRHYQYVALKQKLKAAAATLNLCDGRHSGSAGVYVQSKTIFRQAERSAILNGHGTGNSLQTLLTSSTLPTAPARALPRAMWMDRHLALANGLNYKTDIAYGAYGIEGRAPFLDNRLGEWADSLTSRELVCGREKKVLLRAAYAGALPAEILARPKQGFGAPIAQWLRGPLREWAGDLLPCTLLNEKAQRPAGAQQLWTLLMFAQWARQWKASGSSIAAGHRLNGGA